MEFLPPSLFMCLDVGDVINLWLTCTGLHSRLNSDRELLSALFGGYFQGVHTDTEEYVKIQRVLSLTFSPGSFPLLVITLSTCYLSSLSPRFLSDKQLAVRFCSYGKADLLRATIPALAVHQEECFHQGGKYGHLEVIKALQGCPGIGRGEFERLTGIAFRAACGYKQVHIIRYLLNRSPHNTDTYKLVDYASRSSHLEVFQCAEESPYYDKATCLYQAANAGNVNIVEYIVEKDPSVNYDRILGGAAEGGHLSLLVKYQDKIDMLMVGVWTLCAIDQRHCDVARWLHGVKDCTPFPNGIRGICLPSVEMLELVRELDPTTGPATLDDINLMCSKIRIKCLRGSGELLSLISPTIHCQWCYQRLKVMAHIMRVDDIDVPDMREVEMVLNKKVQLELLPLPFFSYLGVDDLVSLWLTSTSLHSRLSKDGELLSTLFSGYFQGVHTDAEEYPEIQRVLSLVFSPCVDLPLNSFPLLVVTLSTCYLSPLSSHFLSESHLAVVLCSYGKVDLLRSVIPIATVCGSECFCLSGKYGHLEVIETMLEYLPSDEQLIYFMDVAFRTACDYRQLHVVRYFLKPDRLVSRQGRLSYVYRCPHMDVFKCVEESIYHDRAMCLHEAAYVNNTGVIDYLVEKEGDIIDYDDILGGAAEGGQLSLLVKYQDKMDGNRIVDYIHVAVRAGRGDVVRWLHRVRDCTPFTLRIRAASFVSTEMLELVRELDPTAGPATLGDISLACARIKAGCARGQGTLLSLISPTTHCPRCHQRLKMIVYIMKIDNISIPEETIENNLREMREAFRVLEKEEERKREEEK